jgi:GNAT superfamily N-acetyltransferase
MGGRFEAIADYSERGKAIDAALRVISRVVVHPLWRGRGLAVRLIRYAIATKTHPYVEALATMGWVVPMFRLAGMMELRPELEPWDARKPEDVRPVYYLAGDQEAYDARHRILSAARSTR